MLKGIGTTYLFIFIVTLIVYFVKDEDTACAVILFPISIPCVIRNQFKHFKYYLHKRELAKSIIQKHPERKYTVKQLIKYEAYELRWMLNKGYTTQDIDEMEEVTV